MSSILTYFECLTNFLGTTLKEEGGGGGVRSY